VAPSADTSPPGDPGPSEGPESTDPAGRSDLDAYPRPSLAVDVAVMSVVPAAWTTGPDGGRSGSGSDGAGAGRAAGRSGGRSEAGSAALKLAVVLLRRDGAPHAGQWSLPGSFVHEHERLADTVRRTLLDKCGITDLSPTQLQVFDDPKRDSRGWVVSVAHLAVVASQRLAPLVKSGTDHLCFAAVPDPAPPAVTDASRGVGPRTAPLAIPGRQRRLPFDHDEIVTLAVAELRRRYDEHPDPDGLMADRFTLLELRRLHEAIHGRELQKDTFRRQVIDQLEDLHETSDGTVGRPAALFTVLNP